MHIKRAKQEILDSIEAYLQKDEDGHYLIPSFRQRPILSWGLRVSGRHRLWSRSQNRANRSGLLHHHPSYQTERCGSPFYQREGLPGSNLFGHGVHDERDYRFCLREDGADRVKGRNSFYWMDHLCIGDAGADDAAVFTVQDVRKSKGSGRMDHCGGRQSAGVQ